MKADEEDKSTRREEESFARTGKGTALREGGKEGRREGEVCRFMIMKTSAEESAI
jgi:hypothetical protein